MTAATRPLATAITALMGAAVISATPVLPGAAPALPQLNAPQIALASSILDIFKFPAWQQAIANEVEFLAIQTRGLADGAAGFAESAVALPAALVTATQQVFSGNALDALTTVEDWAIAAGEATLVPPIAANIEVGQIQLAIQSALLPAQPIAFVQVGSALFEAFDAVARSFIIAGQDLVDAVLSFNIGNIVQAVIGGVSGVIGGFVDGGQAIVDGIVSAQTTIATALAARPALVPEPYAAATPQAAASAIETAPAADVQASSPIAAAINARAEAGEAAPHRTPGASRGTAAERGKVSQQTADDTDGAAKASSRRGAR